MGSVDMGKGAYTMVRQVRKSNEPPPDGVDRRVGKIQLFAKAVGISLILLSVFIITVEELSDYFLEMETEVSRKKRIWHYHL